MNKNYAKDLFQLQTELIDAKVDMAVSKANDRVVDLIIDLKGQVVDLKSEMNHQFAHLEGRVKTIEKEQNSTAKLLTEVRSKVIDYSFRGGWVILTGVVVLVVGQAVQWLHLIK
jgi:hypothetical protein